MDQDGRCNFASIRNLAHRARMSEDACARAVAVLESPDPDSADPDNEGRRIERVLGGWTVLNAGKYRELATCEQIRESNRVRQQRFRDKQPVTPRNGDVTPRNADVTGSHASVTQSEAEAYTEEESQSLSSNVVRPDTPVPSNGNGKTDPALVDALTAVWEYYCLQTGRNRLLYAFTTQRKEVGLRRLKECLSKTGNVEDAAKLMMAAIDGLTKSDFHMGRDPKSNGKKYHDWTDHLFKSYERMEKWWNA
jgi:hypothetical protein